jgi:hypothetical protein
LALTAGCTAWAAGRGLLSSDDWQAVARALLAFVGISVVAMVVVHLVFHIAAAVGLAVAAGGDDSQAERQLASAMVEDEMDKLIAWKAGRAASAGAGAGLVACLALAACGTAPGLALHGLVWGFAGGGIAEGCWAAWLAERGIGRG